MDDTNYSKTLKQKQTNKKFRWATLGLQVL